MIMYKGSIACPVLGWEFASLLHLNHQMSCRTYPCSCLVMDGRPDELTAIDYSSDVTSCSLFGHICPAERIYHVHGGNEFTCSCVPSSNVCDHLSILKNLVLWETCNMIFKINRENNGLAWKCNLMYINSKI